MPHSVWPIIIVIENSFITKRNYIFVFKKEKKTDKGGGGTKDRIEWTEQVGRREQGIFVAARFSLLYTMSNKEKKKNLLLGFFKNKRRRRWEDWGKIKYEGLGNWFLWRPYDWIGRKNDVDGEN